MYSVDSLTYAIQRLFRGGVGERGYTEEEVEALLENIGFASLLQAVRHEARTVHAYTAQGRPPKSFNYRGADLFGQRATLLYADFDQSCASLALTERRCELWLLEDMDIVAVSCVSVDCGHGEYVTEYREIKAGDPWDTDMCLGLEELADRLLGMCRRCHERDIPVYEL